MSDDIKSDASGAIRGKLIAKKQQWAKDGRLLTGNTGDKDRDRLPPGQRIVKDWPVLDLGVTPKIDLEKWRLRIDGAVQNRIIWDWEDFLSQPQTEIVSDIHCVTGWSRFDNRWVGVPAAHILSLVQPSPDATHCIFYSRDGYATNVQLDRFAAGNVLLAFKWNGDVLSAPHGGPVRVLMPDWYFWKSAKWLRRIEFSTEDKPGYWEIRGYHNDGDPWKEERYSDD
ncbi:MAG: sulfite oxidase-like oxidoreductase [Rhodospirillaceae bacterium]|nr:sulfite oxidase-like oxidoreductase [Rhodospirillaceae bacterium]|tara:strand:- start:5112 stop:5789 length:678 start_codon:yes stop_codon:yes gene_type:complete